MLLGFALLTGGGVLFVVLGWMGLTEKLPRNHIAGIRTPYTMRSDANWYTTHRAAAPLLIFGGVAVAIAGLAFLPFVAFGAIPPALGAAVALVLCGLLLIVVIAGWLHGTRVAQRRCA